MPRSPTRRLLLVFVSVLLSLLLYLFPKEPTQSAKDPQSETVSVESLVVKRVVDGDTLILSNGEKIRLTGIDTPESHSNAKALRDSERSGKDVEVITQEGREAAKFVRKLAEGKKIRIEYDVQKRDRYGRLLVYAYDIDTLKENPQIRLPQGVVVSANREIFLNGSIIGSGYAIPMTMPPNVKHAELFKKLYSEARLQRRGLWAE
jgi:micrococcal nuclease